MTINYDELINIERILNKYPDAKLQIVTKNRGEKTVRELISRGYFLFGENKSKKRKKNLKILKLII